RHVVADAFAIVVVINSQRVLSRLQRSAHDGCSRLFVRADVVTQEIALSWHAQIKRSHVAQKGIQILNTNGILDKVCGSPFRGDLKSRRGRIEILHADRPILTAMAAGTAGPKK